MKHPGGKATVSFVHHDPVSSYVCLRQQTQEEPDCTPRKTNRSGERLAAGVDPEGNCGQVKQLTLSVGLKGLRAEDPRCGKTRDDESA